jgi:peptide/nickel transport system permease protein
MAAFLLRRLGFMILTLFLLSLIIFFAGQILPGDPGRAVLGPFAAQSAVHQIAEASPMD